MHPEICTIGPFTVHSYGLMLVVAFIIAYFLASKEARRQGFQDPEIIFNLSLVSFISGIIGARILYVAENLRYYQNNPLEIIMLQQGGLSWFGGLFLGVISGILYLKRKRAPVYKTLDVLMPFIALAQAIGRIGCLLNGCCFGRPSPFGIYFRAHDAFLIPTQIYSSLLLLSIYVFLRLLQRKPRAQGVILFSYLALYSTKRFFIEFLRADHDPVLLSLTLFQVISCAIFLFAAISLILILKNKGRRR